MDMAFIPTESHSFSQTNVSNDSSCFSSIMMNPQGPFTEGQRQRRNLIENLVLNTVTGYFKSDLCRSETQTKLIRRYLRSIQLKCSKHSNPIHHKVRCIFIATAQDSRKGLLYKK